MTVAKLCSIVFYMAIASFTMLLACQVKKEERKTTYQTALQKTYLLGIFLILFLCSALRFGIGNDYAQYTLTAHEAYVGGYVVTEIGFNWLVTFLYTLFGGEYYELFFALFAFVTLALFLKALYEQSDDFRMSFFLFMTLGLYFQTYNTVRYYLALSVAFYAMKYIWEKDYIRFVLWILFAACFHKSVLLVIPVYLLAAIPWKKWHIITGVVLSVGCWLLKGPVLALALKLYPSYENTIYLSGGTSVSSIIRSSVIVVFYLWFHVTYERHEGGNNQKLRCYAQLNLLALDVYLFFSFLPVVTRIAYYFSITQLWLIPMIVAGIPDKKRRKQIQVMIIIACVIYFAVFLYTADRAGIGLLPYQSWLFQEQRITYK